MVTGRLGNWLDLLEGHGPDPALRDGWNDLRPVDVLRETGRLVLLGESETLLGLWSRVRQPLVSQYLDYHFGTASQPDDPILTGRLAGALRAMTSAALALLAASQRDPTRLRYWLCQSSCGWLDLPPPTDLPSEARPFSSPLEGIEQELALLNGSDVAGRGVPMVRRWHLILLRFLLEQRRIRGNAAAEGLAVDPPVSACRLPLLVHSTAGQGSVLSCGLELVPGGLGRFVPDAGRMALRPVTAGFLDAMESAWNAAAQCRWDLRRVHDPSTVDAHWWLAEQPAAHEAVAVLQGSSQGAAVASALALLLSGDRPLQGVAATAGITLAGDLTPVEGVREKTLALLADGADNSARLLVLHPQNAAEARATIQEARAEAHLELLPVRSLPDLLRRHGALDLLRTFAGAELNWLTVEAGRRIGRSYTGWNDFEDDHFERSVRRVHEVGQEEGEDALAEGSHLGGEVEWRQVAPALRRALLLGPAGTGKTVLLWREVGRRCALAEDLLRLGAAPPDRIETGFYCRAAEAASRLRGHAPTGRALIAALGETARHRHRLPEAFAELFARMASEGRLLIALDALDEVPRPDRGDLLDAVRGVAQEWPGARFLLSARREAYTRGTIPVDDHDVWEVVPLAVDQLEEVVRRWLPHSTVARQALLRFLHTSGPAVQAMRTPLLLRIACRVAAERPPAEGEFLWRSRSDLYAVFIGEMLAGWARQQRDLTTDQEAAMGLLIADVALLWRQRRQQGRRSELPEVIQEVRASYPSLSDRHLTEDLCRIGLLTRSEEQGRLAFTFTHSTFGEFLYAAGLERLVEARGWSEVQEEISDRADEPEGHMAILFLAGLLRDPAPLLRLLADPRRDDLFRHRLALAALCLPEAMSRSSAASSGADGRG